MTGLVVDVFGDHAVVASSAAWVEKYKEIICDQLVSLTGCASLAWRQSAAMLAEEGVPLAPVEHNDSAAEVMSSLPHVSQVSPVASLCSLAMPADAFCCM